MANNVNKTFTKCTSCARIGSQCHLQRPLQLFPASGPLDFVAMDILGPLPKNSQCIQYVLILTYQYSRLTQAISTSKTITTHIASLFFDHWIVSFGIPTFLPTDNGLQFVSEFFDSFGGYPEVRHITEPAYHP